ncbi:MAG TPA: kelch repeat-containing protein [Lacipirellulaceae bacterium]|nr:kelch repeat-containing protein [Lacipirellulaceae bacterium]
MPDLPTSLGLAGSFAGVSAGALIVAGGTNFPDAPPWKHGTKTWHDTAYVLTSPESKWQEGFKLPRPLAYGVSITIDRGLLCIGGCDDSQNYADVFLLEWNGQTVTHQSWPSLPKPTSCAAGALVGSRIFVAGGQSGPNPVTGPSHSLFYMLNLADESPHWRVLPTWPGPERFYAVAGTDGRSFFLFSGIRRVLDKANKPTLEYLNDCYRFDPATEKWSRLTDLPHANAAVASPAPFVQGCLLLLGRGADGVHVDRSLEHRAAFGREVLCYDVRTANWNTLAPLPFGRAAVTAVPWRGAFVVASGEASPGVRSNQVWSVR